MKENILFVLKVLVAHLTTYFVCGLVFSNIFDYTELFKLGNARYFMRETFGVSNLIGLPFQIVRGGLLGLILLLLKDCYKNQQFGWLRLWGIVAGLCIICTSSPAPASIEGIIYTQLPLEFHIKVAPEILTQTLFFSVLVANDIKIHVSERWKQTAIITSIAGVIFSISGIVLALVLHADFMKSATDAICAVRRSLLRFTAAARRW